VAQMAPLINHLLFADDSLLFIKANSDGVRGISSVLDSYCHALGQPINLSKSSIFFSKGCPQTVKDEAKNILNVPNESLSDKYLEMPSDVVVQRTELSSF
jgi:hypothetical protein